MDNKEAVWTHILKPMQEFFPAPTHIRNDMKALGAALQLYERALMRFDPEVLKAAWPIAAAADELWCWPKLIDLVKVCQDEEKNFRRRTATREIDLQDQASSLATKYANSYMKRSQVAALARKEGWDQELKSYVFEVACVQAQFMVGIQNVGYPSLVLKGYSATNGQSPQEQGIDFLKKAKVQAEKGSILVRVPQAYVERCKSMAKGRAAQER